ncbi:hypothetical protein FBEOM_14733 [Fusarium beomiforme]|uniref:Uncharacterized protein n=1 Tax=Fusarium beomiforme TaxID=44412 RepID=A0A9P5DPU8_9HYPO|nr:hypothetical protein FBEOM_14733 [Fusarium beomiforme]
MEPESQIPPRDERDSTSRPTHNLEAIKVGDNGVQLLVSTKDHLYDARDVGAGANSYQVIGSWEETSVQELAKILNQRQVIANQQTTRSAEATRFENTHGAGKSLGEPNRQNQPPRIMNRQGAE